MKSSSSESRTILQVIPSVETGGAEKTTVDIGRALGQIGWKSVVASNGGILVEQLEKDGSKHIDLPLATKNPINIVRNAKRLESLIKSEGVDLIHARSRAPAWSALMASKRTGIPFVTTYHGAYSQSNFLKEWYNSVMVRSDRVIANSQWTADYIQGRHTMDIEKLVVIPRGTNFQDFSMDAIPAERIEKMRQFCRIDEGDIVVLLLGRLAPRKGHKVLIEAASGLIEQFPNLKIVLAGDDQGRDGYSSKIKNQISSLGLDERVVLTGHCDDPATALAVADIVVQPSIREETFGRTPVEAGALCKPVIVTRLGAVIETVMAPPEATGIDQTGWKVEPNNTAQFRQALVDVLALSSSQRREIGQQARKFVTAHFSLEQMCDKTITVYRDLLEN